MKVQSLKSLELDMRRIARGDAKAPRDAARPSAESAEALFRVLTPKNRELLRIIRDKEPPSVSALAKLAKRAEPNLLRTLSKLEAFGLVELVGGPRRRAPRIRVRRLSVQVDLFGPSDKVSAILSTRRRAA